MKKIPNAKRHWHDPRWGIKNLLFKIANFFSAPVCDNFNLSRESAEAIQTLHANNIKAYLLTGDNRIHVVALPLVAGGLQMEYHAKVQQRKQY